MTRIVTILSIGILFALALIGVVAAQSGALAGLAQPFLVNIEQSVPVDLTLAVPLDDGKALTVTAPITIGIALQVKIDGAHVVGVMAAETEPATVKVVEEEAPAAASEQDSAMAGTSGIPYEVQAPDGLTVLQINSKATFGKFVVFGEMRNDGDHPFEFISISASLYDSDGNLVDVAAGLARATTLEPGKETTFEALSTAEAERIASYAVQIESLH